MSSFSETLSATMCRGTKAPTPRTLVDIFRTTVETHPDALAIDTGTETLTYTELHNKARDVALQLAQHAVGHRDRVGVRVPSGTADLYIAILGIIMAGAAYVPVDVDDPDERARTVFDEADVAAIITADLHITTRTDTAPNTITIPDTPHLGDDAWIIFTSGSTGKPKGVAVTHRNAAAFVDAEANLFLQQNPLGPHDRVMAGLSVAFDASCEEMWLAWRYGACLVPAPRALVRSGMDLGPWLIERGITVVSTVPTLVALWPAEALHNVRLLILGGEACPPEIGARYATTTREVWNTYGPTEATVVTCAAQLTGQPPVRIGLPLDGWDMAVVDSDGQHVQEGEVGELIIAGVGLARYLDPAKDQEKYAPMPTLGWDRAYRSGDLVRFDTEGLVFMGRADDQVKVGGRRIELGEIDAALLDLPGVNAAAAAVRSSKSGNKLLVGYIAVDDTFNPDHATKTLRAQMPAALVPRLAIVDELPTRTSGKIDRDALPWPLASGTAKARGLGGTAALVATVWQDVLGADVTRAKDNFFTLGGNSLTAAQIVAQLREDFATITVADLYDHPTVGKLARFLDGQQAEKHVPNEPVTPISARTKWAQLAILLLTRSITGLRWGTYAAAASNIANTLWGATWAPHLSWWFIATAWVFLIFPPGKMLLSATIARLLTHRIQPGNYPRGGSTHLRVWAAERFAEETGAITLASAPLIRWYARLLGAHVGKNVDLHAVPPITGHLHLGDECAIEPEVDLTGHWVDGHTFHIGHITVGARARVGARSTLHENSTIGAAAEIAPGSGVFGEVPANERWSGAPASAQGPARGPWHSKRPRQQHIWQVAYFFSGIITGALPAFAALAGVAVLIGPLQTTTTLADAALTIALWLPAAVIVGYTVLAATIIGLVRLLAIGLSPGAHPVQSRVSWQAWSTLRLLDEARSWLYPLYASSLTPWWLRALGAKIGRNVEASTALMIPSLVTVAQGAFLADDTLIGGYELGGGWLRLERVKIGKKSFVGNSGMAAPGRKVPKRGLVAVLSAAPERTKAKAGTSWIGSPPEKLRRQSNTTNDTVTYQPTTALKTARALVETCRLIPTILATAIAVGFAGALLISANHLGWALTFALSGAALILWGTLAASIATIAKWLLVGKITASEHPLWSSFVWRNELADTFVELIAAPWFARPATATPLASMWWRSMGARIGRGVWCETYWLPEADLVTLGDGATVNRGCVVQTHLFHDRVLAMDEVHLATGATLGPNGVVLPASTIEPHATIGPVSLVMRGETVPTKTRWIGNPIGPWTTR